MPVTINGTSTAVIPNASGNVGVGTASPNATGWGRAITINGAASTNGAVELTENGTLRGYMSYTVGGGLNVYAAAGQVLGLGSNNLEAMRIDTSGNVGIGTSTINYRLVADCAAVANNDSGISVRNANTGAYGGSYNFEHLVAGGGSVVRASYISSEGGGSASFLRFATTNSGTLAERVRITGSGDLCVGTTSSGGYKLRVDGTTGAYVTTVNNTAIYGYASGSGLGVQGQSVGNYGVNGSSTNSYGGYFSSTNYHGMYAQGLYYGIYGQTTNSGYGGVIGFAQNGYNYGILGYANAWALYGTGSAYISGTYQGSDERLKENIQDLGNSLDKIAQLRAVTFDWKPNTDASLNGTYADVGLIAQEAINVLPNIVKETTAPPVLEGKTPTLNQELGTFYTIDYGKLIPYMVDAIQELKQQNDALVARVAALEAK